MTATPHNLKNLRPCLGHRQPTDTDLLIFCQMKTSQLSGILVLLAIIVSAVIYSAVTKAPKNPDVVAKQDELHLRQLDVQIQRVERNDTLRYYGIIAVLGAVNASLLMLAGGVARAHLKRASVHQYKIGDNEIVVHDRDLPMAQQVAMGLINAETLRQYNAGMDQAFQLNMQMAALQSKNFRAMTHHDAPLLPALSDMPALDRKPVNVPTFQELLNRGDIQQGKQMILGFEAGAARRGSFLDIYSAAVAGESGSGKTGTLLYLIGSGIISERVRFLGIDPHYPHPKSLGYKTKALWDHGLMQMATNIVAMEDMLKEVETTIANRLKQLDTDTTPTVLVIDELAYLNRSSLGKALAHTMERISTEGRKCAVYMLASSQTWLVARTGDSSAVRDTLTSAYVHRIKPKQANLLLQSKDASQTVERYVKKPGECLLVPVCDDPVVCTMPLTTEHDMLRVANMVEPIFPGQWPVNAPVNGQQSLDRPLTPGLSDVDLIDRIKSRLTQPGDQGRLAKKFGYDPGFFSRILKGEKKLPLELREKMIQDMTPGDVIPFPQ